jgi:hypothetical protein
MIFSNVILNKNENIILIMIVILTFVQTFE